MKLRANNLKLKFRVWNKRYRKYYDIYEIDFDNGLIFCKSKSGSTHTFGFIDCIIEQYIGSKDYEGVEIYDGNILIVQHRDYTLQDDDLELHIDMSNDEWFVSKVQPRGIITGSFGHCDMWLIDWAIDSDYIIKVIGNIHENPELLEK